MSQAKRIFFLQYLVLEKYIMNHDSELKGRFQYSSGWVIVAFDKKSCDLFVSSGLQIHGFNQMACFCIAFLNLGC